MGLILNNRYKFGFVHIPKTGGRTLTHLLLKIKDSTEVTSHHGLSLLPDDSSYFYFTIVRNPFTRMVSAYKHECRKFGFVEFDSGGAEAIEAMNESEVEGRKVIVNESRPKT